MAVFEPIPQPKSGVSAFDDFFNDLAKRKLMASQSEEAKGAGAKNAMIAKLLGGATGGAGASGGQNLDLVAGLLGIPVTTNVVNGQIVKFNPLKGAYESQKVGENEGEKRAGETEAAITKKGGELGQERAEKLIESSRALLNTKQLAQHALDLLAKNPNATGNIAGIQSMMGLNHNEETPALKSVFGSLQSEFGHGLGARGGVGVQKIAAQLKPSLFNQADYNINMLKEIIRQANSAHTANSSEYKNLTKKEIAERLGEAIAQPETQEPAVSSQAREEAGMPGSSVNSGYQEPVNEDKLQGQVPPPGTIWMINPKTREKIAVHQDKVQEAKAAPNNFQEVG